jgi:hypothetical protein
MYFARLSWSQWAPKREHETTGKGAVIGARSIGTKDVPRSMWYHIEVNPRLIELSPSDSNSFIDPLPPLGN